MKFDLSFWKTASSKRKRIYLFVFLFVVAVALTVIGSYLPISHSDAQTISQNLNDTLKQHRADNTLPEYIFINNFSICLLMFVPVAGAVLGCIILFDTGVALGAIASIQGYPVWFGFLNLIVTPVFWLEFTAYSIAMAESIWLTRRLMQHRWMELKNTAILIGICAGLLIVGAFVEAWLIGLGG